MSSKEQKTIDQLYSKLSEYLISQGVNASAPHFACIARDHDDSTPSAHVVPHHEHIVHCFGCHRNFNIFQAAHEIEGLPLRGADFWKVTVPELAKRFNVPFEERELSDEDRDRLKILAAYRDAADVVCIYPEENEDYDTPIYEYIEARGWTKETAMACNIGAVPGPDQFMEQMNVRGWDNDYLKSIGLGDRQLFARKNLIFTVCDENGRPRGFAARDTKWHEGGGPKYWNTTSNEIYHKGELLFNFYNAKRQLRNEKEPLWIVEGYADVPTLWQAGIKNVAGVGGTAFTEYHVQLLNNSNCYNLNFMFDNDNYEGKKRGGQESLASIVDKFFKSSSIFNVKIRVLPAEYDPDEFIKEKGVEEFQKLPLISPFEWRLNRIPYDADPYEIAQSVVPDIAMEESAVQREKMINILVATSGIAKEVITLDVERELKKHDKEAALAKKQWAEKSEYKLRDVMRGHSTPDEVLEEISHEWQDVQKKFINIESEDEKYKSKLRSIRKMFLTESTPPFEMGCFRQWADKTHSIKKTASFIGLAAVPNVGKTSLLRHISWELIKNNEDAFVIYFSLDDPFQKIISAFLAMEMKMPINTVREANQYIIHDTDKLKRWKYGWDKFDSIKDRLIIKDITDGATLAYIEKTIKYYKAKYPHKNVVAIVDSFNKIRDYMNHDKESRASLISGKLKGLVGTYDIPLIAILELRKTDAFKTRPTIMDIKNSRAMEYDCDMILLMHQELHIDPDSKWYYWAETEYGNIKMPIVEVHFAKNKESEFKGKLYMKFRSDQSRFEEISPTDVKSLLEQEGSDE